MIRTASAEDAGGIARLCGQLGYPAASEQIRHRMREILGREGHAVVVNERGSSLVGWAHVSVLRGTRLPMRQAPGGIREGSRMSPAGRELRRWSVGGIFSPTAGTAGVARIRPDGLLRIGPRTP